MSDIIRPRGPADLSCPLSGKSCAKVCHTCALWKPVEFTANHPQTGDRVEKLWDCSLSWTHTVGMDTGRRIEQVSAEMNMMRNEFAAFRASLIALVGQLARLPSPQAPALEGGQLKSQVEVSDA